MKVLIATVCVLAALFECTEAFQCYDCPLNTLTPEECARNATKINCSNGWCVSLSLFVRNSTNNALATFAYRSCTEEANCLDICNEGVLPVPSGYTFDNCSHTCCNESLCNSSPETTTPMPITSVPITNANVSNTTDASSPLVSTEACPRSSGKQCFYVNSVVITALLFMVSLVRVNSC